MDTHITTDSRQTIVPLFEHQVQIYPDEIAITYKNLQLTYSQFNEKVNQLAHQLRGMGVKPDTIVAICLERSIDYLIAMLAVIKAGGAFLPLEEKQPVDRQQLILQDSQSLILLTKSHVAEKFGYFQGQIILLDRDDGSIQNQSKENPSIVNKPTDLVYVIYTSGTTGAPKGVMIEHHNVVNYIAWFADFSKCLPLQRIDFSTNPIFDMAITNSLAPLCLGMQIIICSEHIKKDLHEYIKFLRNSRINVIKFTPSYFKILLHEIEADPVDLPDVKTLIFGGEILLTSDCARWFSLYPKHIIYNEYGPTEITVAFCQFKVTNDTVVTLGIDVPIGKPGHNMTYMLDESSELLIGGQGLARGYLNKDKLTQQRFITIDGQRYYKTGDICRVLPTGNLVFLGRNDDQVKIRGFRIEPAEIETILSSYPTLTKVVVLPQEIQPGEKQLVAYYLPKDLMNSPDADELREFLALKVSDYMIPSAFVKVDRFKLNENNKLDKSALPPVSPMHTKKKELPQTQLERLIASIWADALHLGQVGRDENFFALGGHSLSAARIVSKLIKATGKRVYIQDIYISGTITELAKVIDQSEKADLQADIREYNSLVLPLSDFQLMFWMSNIYEPKTKTLNVVARKRFYGKLNSDAIEYACNELLNRQELLSYKILTMKPLQVPRKRPKFFLDIRQLNDLPAAQTEVELKNSMNNLIKHYPWRKDRPAFIARLFYLDGDMSELQICMPHIFSDDYSTEVAFRDLSEFYIAHFQRSEKQQPKKIEQYKEYVNYEFNHINRNLDRDITYWESYLADTALIPLPIEYVVKDMRAKNLRYSSYFVITDEVLNNLRKRCAKNQVNLAHALCASVGLMLAQFYDNKKYKNQNIFFNIIKTTRDDEAFDGTIGCFLKLDAYKLDMNKDRDLISTARVIQKSMIENEPYQHCAGLLKLACLNRSFREKFKIVNFLLHILARIYTGLFSSIKINPQIIKMYGSLFFFGRDQYFLTNINLWGNFIGMQNKHLFALKQKNLALHEYDLSVINNVLDICFLRDDNNVAHLVISGNLRPEFRRQLGEIMLDHLSE